MSKTGKKWVRFRHKVVHRVAMAPAKLILSMIYGFRGERFDHSGLKLPCFILGNHTTPLDPVCLGTSFRFPIYYVASDHIFRLGIVSSILKYLVAPIPIMKSRLDLRTIKDMMTVIAEGGSVSLFPEGNRNYNGETAPISPAVAKLAKQFRIPLVLYRIEGGYLTAPRWADTLRHGRMTGRVVRVVGAEELEKLTSDELYTLIKTELYENAYRSQEERAVPFRGSRLAVALERALYLCPGCLGMATLKSRDNELSCGCGMKARYTLFGRLEPLGAAKLPFRTVLEWDRWQKQTLPEWLAGRMRETSGLEPLVCDGGQRLFGCDRAGETKLLGTGDFSLFPDKFRFECEGHAEDFLLGCVSRLRIHGKQSLQFSTDDGSTYEVKSPFPRSALKYMNLFELIKNKDREVRHDFIFSL